MISELERLIERERRINKIAAQEELARRRYKANPITEDLREIYLLDDKFREDFNSDYKYLIFKGGRGGGKSIAISGYLIEQSYNRDYAGSVFLCVREIAVSIEDSVYGLIVDLIAQAGLTHEFKILARSITNKSTGIKFVFTGLRATGGKTAFSQIDKIKGKHAISMIYLEEGATISFDSLNVLFPTVNRSGTVKLINEWRKEADLFKSTRFLVALNPNFDQDPIIAKTANLANAKTRHINIFDLAPEFQDSQLIEQAAQEKDEIYYDHVWMGAPSYKIQGFPFAGLEAVNYAGDLIAHTCFLDPSFKGGDHTAITFVGMVSGQLCVWGYAFKSAWNKQLEQIADLCKRFNCQNNFYEDNSLGSVPQELFSELGLDFIAHTTLGNKEARIYKVAYYTVNRTKLIITHSNTAYVDQVKKYQEGEKLPDDAPDSYASAMIKAGIVTDKMKF